MRHDLTDQFLQVWKLVPHSAPEPVRELKFAAPARKWAFDMAWPDWKLAVEWEGGTWNRGAHTRGRRYQSDCEKYNRAALLGWRVLRYTTDDLRKRPAQVVEEICEALSGGELPSGK